MVPKDAPSSAAPSRPTWEVESLRLTAFLIDPVAEQKWWAELLGGEPERSVTDRRAQTQQDQGSFANNRLTLLVRGNRVDWVLSPKEDQEPSDAGIVSIGLRSESLGAFVDAMRRWVLLSGPVKRLALGMILLQPVEDRTRGYRELARFLPAIQLDAERSSDFSYQINRRRRSTTGVPSLEINRLSKWSVALFSYGTVSVGATAAPDFIRSRTVSALRLELDVNTAQEFEGALPGDKLPPLLEELVDLSVEISEKGDLP